MNAGADRVAYGYVLSCDTLEQRGEAPLPQLTPQLAGWIARCSARAVELWGHEYGDMGLAENATEVIALAARFAVDGWLDEGGRQFTCFGLGQIAAAAGWDDDRVRRALGACRLDMAPRLSRKGSRFCRDLLARGEAPFLGLIKAGKKGQSSTYRFVGIEPPIGPQGDGPNGRPAPSATGTKGGAEPAIGCCQTVDSVVPNGQLGGAKTGLGGANSAIGWCREDNPAPPNSVGFGGAEIPAQCAGQYALAAETRNSPVMATPPYSPAFGGASDMLATPPSSYLYINSSLSLSSSVPASEEEEPPLEMYADLMASAEFDRDREIRDFKDKGRGTPGALLSAEDVPVDPDSVETPDALASRGDAAEGVQGAYARLKGLFPCAPGAKEGETYRKFVERVEVGYRPEDIVDGAWDYLASPNVPPSEKWRYPLKWLSDEDAFGAFVRRAPEPPLSEMPAHERARRAKFVHCGNDRESFWLVMEKGGAQTEVDCDPDCTVEEARGAFELQLLREQRAEFGEEW